MTSHATLLRVSIAIAFLAASAFAATTPSVTVLAPVNTTQASSPVRYLATAASPGCAAGIASMRIYTAPGVGLYTVTGGRIDTNVTLANGTHNTVVQAWDNCGGVGKTSVKITVISQGGISTGGLPLPRFVYVTEHNVGKVAGYLVDPATGSLQPTGQAPVWAHWGPLRVVSDRGGYRLYVINEGSHDINAYFIDHRNGYLYPVPGSPFPVAGTGTHITVDPTGRFVYATADASHGGQQSLEGFSVASDGSLHELAGSPYMTGVNPRALIVDSGGKYLYVSVSGAIAGYAINQTDGELTPVLGSPFRMPDRPDCIVCGDSPSDFGVDFATDTIYGTNTGDGTVVGFGVDNSTGALTNLPGSPYVDLTPGGNPEQPGGGPISIAVPIDSQYVYATNVYTSDIAVYKINNDASLTLIERTPSTYGGTCSSGILRSDPSGRVLYSLGASLPQCGGGPAILGFSIDPASGDLSAAPNSPFPDLNVFTLEDGIAITP